VSPIEQRRTVCAKQEKKRIQKMALTIVPTIKPETACEDEQGEQETKVEFKSLLCYFHVKLDVCVQMNALAFRFRLTSSSGSGGNAKTAKLTDQFDYRQIW
jgi:hypothetical protein